MMRPAKVGDVLAGLPAALRARAGELRAEDGASPADVLERLAADLAAAVGAVEGCTPLPADRLWTQQEAAYYLGVSARYLRESSCPKVLLPGTGKKGQPVVRYDPAAVQTWKDRWTTGTSTKKAS